MKLISLKNIYKKFNDQFVLNNINLEINENQFVTLLGPSGCGKTTTLRIIGGFIEPTEGQIYFEGHMMNGVPPYLRPTNTVFQKYSLFPHLNVYDNVVYGLKVKQEILGLRQQVKKLEEDLNKDKNFINLNKSKKKEVYKSKKKSLIEKLKLNKKEINKEVQKFLKLVGLTGFEKRNILKLSGGQQQRVAIARALINKPKVLLLDEPLAALDLKLRQEMQYELKNIQRSSGVTFIYVTHDQEEALTMSDKVVVMNNGKILQQGSPEDIYNEPKNKFVASFIGDSNIIPGIMKKDFLVHFDQQDFVCVDKGFKINQAVDVVIRPEDIDITTVKKGLIEGQIINIVFKGVHFEILVKTKYRDFMIHTTDSYKINQKVGLKFNDEDIHVMSSEND